MITFCFATTIKNKPMYSFSSHINHDFSSAINIVTEALGEKGFGILTEIDVQATLKKKLNIDKNPYTILGACNPGFANKALDSEPEIGVLLPCNVVVTETSPGKSTVIFMDPEAVLNLTGNPDIKAIVAEVRQLLEEVKDIIENK